MEMKEKEAEAQDQGEAAPAPAAATQETDAPPKKDLANPWVQFWSVNYTKKQIKNAKDTSNPGFRVFRLAEVLCGSFACFLCMVLMSALPIAMIVIGSVYLDDCPGQRFIPIWLIVFGCFSVVQTFFNSTKRCTGCVAETFDDDNGEEGGKKKKGRYTDRGGGCCESLIDLFLFAWLITGSVWVFQYYDNFQDSGCQIDPVCMCERVPYLFSFVTIIVIWGVSAICLIGFCIGITIYGLVVGASAMSSNCDE